MPTVSLCMIVNSEEKNIRRCLESAKEFVSEIIVVDTGGEDRTRSICEEYGAKIFDYKWADDFSEARNYSLSKASGDWILLLDADEELKVQNSAGLKEYLQNTDHDMILIRMTHFYGNEPADEKRAHFSGGLRLIRNDGDIRFEGKIHERIVTDGKSVDHTGGIRKYIGILHYGYMEDAMEKKQDRNIPLILKEKDGQTSDSWLSYYIAAEHYRLGRLPEAYQEVNEAIAQSLLNGLKPPSLAYKLKYDILLTSGYHDTAYNGIEKATAIYPDYVDLHFYKGILQFGRGEYEKAQNTLLYCMILGESNMEYLILSGSGSFLAMYYLGLCHEKKGESEQAAEAFAQAERLCPDLNLHKGNFENLQIYFKPFK